MRGGRCTATSARDSIVVEVEQSLKRLGTDYIDHYITHWQDPTTPIVETMESLEKLKAQGKIRSIGASNVSTEDVKAYLAAGQLDAVQQEYSMLKRDIERDLLPVCIESGLSVLSYSSLALGLLSGKIGPERVFTGDDQRKDNPLFSLPNRRKVARLWKISAISPTAMARRQPRLLSPGRCSSRVSPSRSAAPVTPNRRRRMRRPAASGSHPAS